MTKVRYIGCPPQEGDAIEPLLSRPSPSCSLHPLAVALAWRRTTHSLSSLFLGSIESVSQSSHAPPRVLLPSLRSKDALDRYIFGHGDMRVLKVETKWEQTWGFDFNQYAKIFHYAHENGIRLVGLNAPQSLLHLINKVTNTERTRTRHETKRCTETTQKEEKLAAVRRSIDRQHVAVCPSRDVGDADRSVRAICVNPDLSVACLREAALELVLDHLPRSKYLYLKRCHACRRVFWSSPPDRNFRTAFRASINRLTSFRRILRRCQQRGPVSSQVGIAGLPDRLQEILPEMDLGNQAHRKRFEDAIRGFQHGAGIDAEAMNRMYEAQTLWDEYMAESASR